MSVNIHKIPYSTVVSLEGGSMDFVVPTAHFSHPSEKGEK